MIVDGKPPIKVIADKNSSKVQLVWAIENLGAKNEAPKFWTDIVENEAYSKFHRRHSVFQLFYRHVKPGMTLLELALILRNPAWLRDSDIAVVEDLGGYIPVSLSFDNTVFVLDIIPDPSLDSAHWCIYMSMAGQVDLIDFCLLLRGGIVDNSNSKTTILEIGFSPPIVDSLRSTASGLT